MEDFRAWWEEWRERLDIGAIVALGLVAAIAVGMWVVVGFSNSANTSDELLPLPSVGPSTIVDSPQPEPSASADPSALPSPSVSPGASASPKPEPSTAPVVATASSAPGGPVITMTQTSSKLTGKSTGIEVHIVDPGGGLAAWVFSFGVANTKSVDTVFPRSFPENGTTTYDLGEIDHYAAPCKETRGWKSSPVDTTLKFARSFRVPGAYTAYIAVKTRSCDGVTYSGYGLPQLGSANVSTGALKYSIGGQRWVNGSAAPRVSVGFNRSRFEGSGSRENLGAGPEIRADDDGVITRVEVDWGDGAKEAVSFNPEDNGSGTNGGCNAVKEFGAPRMDVVARPDHSYAEPGTYSVIVTVTSATCDGSSQQVTRRTATYEYRA